MRISDWSSDVCSSDLASMTGGVASGAVAGAVTADPAAPRSAGSLKVVLPARTDRFGRWRDETVVYVEPQLAGAARDDRRLAASVSSAPARLSLVELAAGPPAPAARESASVPTSGNPGSRSEKG